MRTANTKAKNYYQMAFVEEDMVEEEKNKLDDVSEKTTGESVKDEGRRRNLVDLLLKQENITNI